MQIILISDRLAKARSVNITKRHLMALSVLALSVVCACAIGLYWLTLRYAQDVPLPGLQKLLLSAQEA